MPCHMNLRLPIYWLPVMRPPVFFWARSMNRCCAWRISWKHLWKRLCLRRVAQGQSQPKSARPARSERMESLRTQGIAESLTWVWNLYIYICYKNWFCGVHYIVQRDPGIASRLIHHCYIDAISVSNPGKEPSFWHMGTLSQFRFQWNKWCNIKLHLIFRTTL